MEAGRVDSSERSLNARAAVRWVVALIAVAAALARPPEGPAWLPAWVEVVLQAPLIVLWLASIADSFGPPPFASAGVPRRTAFFDAFLAILVVAAALVVVRLTNRWTLIAAVPTCYIVGTRLLEAVVRWAGAIERAEPTLRNLSRLASAYWLTAALVGTILLSLPVATISAVPDYRHNFWRHVVQAGHTATSAVCLVGSGPFSLATDFTAFGRFVVYALMHVGAFGSLVLGMRALRLFLPTAVTVPRVAILALLVEIAGAAALLDVWRAADAPTITARIGWSLFHASAALYSCGMSLRADGLATYLGNGRLFSVVTGLMIVGSIGLPAMLAIVLPRSRWRDTGASRSGNATVAALRGLINVEFAVAFWLLIVGAAVLFLCETPGAVPMMSRGERPLDVGANLVPLSEMPAGTRWRAAVLMSANSRSGGMPGIPVVEGTVSWAGRIVLCLWMFIGGAVGSFAGGVRTTTLAALARLWLYPGADFDVALRRGTLRGLLRVALIMVLLTGVSVAALWSFQDASAWERILDGIAGTAGSGWSTGLAPHLTWAARCSMIVVMLAGRWIPLVGWCVIAGRLERAA